MSQQTVAHLKGTNGSYEVVSGDSAITFLETVDAIQAINGADVTITAGDLKEEVCLNPSTGAARASKVTTIQAGTIIYGRFTGITVQTGTAKCYIM